MEGNAKKICKICGDYALSCNFGALSCGTCKIFFRRNALKQEDLKCKYNTDSCVIDSKANRKRCKSCRLRKCLIVGMKPELVPNEKHKQNTLLSKTVDKNAQLSNLIMVNVDEMKRSYIQNEPNSDGYEFDQLELDRFAEIQRAMSHFPNEFQIPNTGQVSDLLHAFNLPSLYVRKIVKFCKSIQSFRCLSQDDQIEILRGFYCEISNLRFAFLFDPEQDAFCMIGNEDENCTLWWQMNVFLEFHRPEDIAGIYRNFYIRLKQEMQNDYTLRNMIIAHFLFNDRQYVSCPAYLKTNLSIYNKMLRKYVFHKYSDPQKYTSLMEALNGLSDICTVTKDLYKLVPSNKLTKVLTEIYYHPVNHNQLSHFHQDNWFNFKEIHELQSSTFNIDRANVEICYDHKPANLIEILNLGEFYVHKAVKFCGYFSSYNSLAGEDKKNLLKHSILDMAIVYIAHFYDAKKDGVPLIMNETGEKAMFMSFKKRCIDSTKRKIVSIFKKFVCALSVEMHKDTFIRNLILIQLLFKARKNQRHPNVENIKYRFVFYRRLMLRYFEYKFKDKQIREAKFQNILNIIDIELEIVVQAIRYLYTREIDVCQLKPLLKEIFEIE